jgi:hypothetical protein
MGTEPFLAPFPSVACSAALTALAIGQMGSLTQGLPPVTTHPITLSPKPNLSQFRPRCFKALVSLSSWLGWSFPI